MNTHSAGSCKSRDGGCAIPTATCSSAPLSSWQVFPHRTSLFQLTPAVSSCSHAPLFKAWLCLLGNIIAGIGKLLLGFPKVFVPAGWTIWVPWAFPQRTSVPTPWASWWPSLSSHCFTDVLGAQNWTHYSKCSLESTQQSRLISAQNEARFIGY